MPVVKVRYPDGRETTHPLNADAVLFGRSAECDLVFEAKGVSRKHGRFARKEDGRWWVEDLGSTNGILVAGRPITRHPLIEGSVLQVGSLTLTFWGDAGAGPVSGPAVTISEAFQPTNFIVERTAGTVQVMDSRRLTALYEISKRLMDQRDVAGLVDVASSALITNLEAGVVVLGLTCDPQREAHKLIVRPTQAGVGITLSLSVLRRTIDARRAVLVADISSDDDLALAKSIVAAGIHSALCVPMMRNEAVTGFIYVDSRRAGRAYDERDLEFACAVGAVVATAIENTRLHEEELIKQRMEAELASARRVQQAILPSRWPRLPGFEIEGRHMSCREIGGDYYDAIVSDDGRLWLLIADVSGKGAPAALQANSIHTALYALVDQCASPSELLSRLNALLLRREVQHLFVTCLAAMIAPEGAEVLLASAGHPYPIQVAPGQPADALPLDNGLVLGSFPEAQYVDTLWSFPAAGGALILYTDGVTEAFNGQHEQFGDQRLLEALSARGSASAEELVTAVQNAVEDFRGDHEQSDDLTLLACRRKADS